MKKAKSDRFMDLSAISLDAFLCADNCCETGGGLPDIFDNVKLVIDNAGIGPQIVALGQGYAIHFINRQDGDAVLLFEGEPVGAYITEVVAISAKHQGKGLSVPLILATVAMRPPPAERKLTVAGKAALTRAWKVANGLEKSPWPLN